MACISGDIISMTVLSLSCCIILRELWKKVRSSTLSVFGSRRSRMNELSMSMFAWKSALAGSIDAAIEHAWPMT